MASSISIRFVVLILVLALAPVDALSPAAHSGGPPNTISHDARSLDPQSGPDLGQEAKFQAPRPQTGALFGYDVDVDGDTLVASAPSEEIPSQDTEGAVYVFERTLVGWSLVQKIVSPDGPGIYGRNLLLEDDTLLVSDASQWTSGGARAGAVYVYERNGSTWSLDEKLEGTVPNEGLGSGLALEDDTAFLGVRPNHEVTGEIDPRTQVYVHNNGTWTRVQTLMHGPSGPNHASSMALSNGTALIGGEFDSHSAYVYEETQDDWTLSATLEDPTPEGASGYTTGSPSRGYGFAADLAGDRALLGEFYERSAHVFVRTPDGWELETTLEPPEGASHYYGLTVAMEDDLALVGSLGEELMAWQIPRLLGVGERGVGSDAGAVYVYERGSGGWSYEGRLTARDAGADDAFGNALDIEGGTAAIGAYADEHQDVSAPEIVDLPTDEREDHGSAYTFSLDTDSDDLADRAERWKDLEVDNPDTDGDRIDDGTEIVCGWDPGDSTSPSGAGGPTASNRGPPAPVQDHRWWLCEVIGS